MNYKNNRFNLTVKKVRNDRSRYLVQIEDTQNEKPTITLSISDEGWTGCAPDQKWQISFLAYHEETVRGEATGSYRSSWETVDDWGGCPTKKELLYWLSKDGYTYFENDIHLMQGSYRAELDINKTEYEENVK